MTVYSIAPTDLTFTLKNCPHCFRAKVVDKWRKPFTPFPSVFNKIDGAMRDAFSHSRAETLGLPPGILDTSPGKAKSSPTKLPSGDEYVINGKLDCKILFDNGSVGVQDFKTSEANESQAELYFRQLHAYWWALTHPSSGDPVRVTYLGLLSVTPEKIEAPTGSDQTTFIFKQKRTDIRIEPGLWDSFMADVDKIIHSPANFDPYCPDCHLRKTGWVPRPKASKSKRN